VTELAEDEYVGTALTLQTAIGFLLIYTQVEETLDGSRDEADRPIEAADTTPASTD